MGYQIDLPLVANPTKIDPKIENVGGEEKPPRTNEQASVAYTVSFRIILVAGLASQGPQINIALGTANDGSM